MNAKSITRRWVKGNLLITIAVLLLFELGFLLYVRSYYYEGARNSIMSRVNTLTGQLKGTEHSLESERSLTLQKLSEEFVEKDKFEFMLLGETGNPLSTASGFVPSYLSELDDFEKANLDPSGTGEYIGKTVSGENIMAITYLVPEPAAGIVAVRLVTSLEGIDEQIFTLAVMSASVVVAILLFSVASGMYFVRSIVMPLSKVEQTATKIAAGDFQSRTEVFSGDEIGRLCNTINYMAAELEKTENMKNEFISSVSHELRTPLTSIKGWAETLARVNDPSDKNYQKGLGIVISETDRLYNMVEELLDFSRMQNGGVTLSCEMLDLVAEVSDAVLTASQRAATLEVEMVFDEPMMPCPVYADPAKMRQIFLNLLDNALKYAPARTEIVININCDGKQIIITIEDKGAGIHPDDLASIKNKFFKGRGAVAGSGIGLAVVDELCRAQGGDFIVESEYGTGTTAIVKFPLKINDNRLKS